MTAAAIEPEPVPLTRDAAGRLIVIGTRVPLDTLVAAFERGDSPEAIHESYPTVSLGDIYAIFTYCVRHRDDVNDYLAGRAGERAALCDRDGVPARGPPRKAPRPAGRMTIKFLADENFDHKTLAGLKRREPDLDIVSVARGWSTRGR